MEPAPRVKLVFVIDDAGNNLAELEPFLRFPGPLTIAVLPGLAHSAEAALRIRAAGKEVFLHQPMEALGGQDPGPGAIYIGMNAGEVREIIIRNIGEIGPVAGMNNHQGSRITMDAGIMETVLALCRERGLCFLDSRTTADTVAPALAEQMGLKIGERDTFIDNDQERASMIRSIREGLGRAGRRGSSVMIGHTWSRELAGILTELYPSFIEQGYTLSTASAFIAGNKAED
ncbi:MAG: divergent polysaccharide deacetylase family protein [Treponema sp.]|nr:divergent polysaccharide deacetylase family protein [Treponema sp.]